MTRGFLWENLESEIAAEFESLAGHGLHDYEAPGGLSAVRSDLRKSLSNAREWLRDDHAEAAERYRNVSTPRRNWGAFLRLQVNLLVPPASCSRGHDLLDEENRKTQGDGRVACKKCNRDDTTAKRKKERGMKERLEVDRAGTTHHFTITARCDLHDAGDAAQLRDCEKCGGSGVYEVKGYITVNTYPDGRLGEIFVGVGKTTSTEAWIDQWARAASFALQYGAPVDEFFGKFVATRFEPSGATRHKVIKRCTSVLDYVARWVLLRFGTAETREKLAQTAASVEAVQP